MAVSTPTDSRAVALLLPLAAGLLIVAIFTAVPAGGGALLGVLILLTLGAVLPGHSWRTGAIAALPNFIVTLVAAAAESLGMFALVLASFPIVVAICAGG